MTIFSARADYTNTVISDGPVAFYPINATVDPTGQTATDVSGYGNNGVYNGDDPEFNTVPGPTPYLPDALAFDGFTAYVGLSGIQNPGLLNFGGTITMEAWVQPANSTEGPADILAKGDDSTQNYNEITLRANAGNYYGGSFNFTNGSGNVSGGQQTTAWSYVVSTYDGTNWNIYQNAQLVGQSPSAWGAINFSDNWNIGVGSADAGPTASNPRWFAGNICYVALYTNALTPAQILNHYYSAELDAPAATSVPIIVTQPQSQAAYVNGSVTFTVSTVSALATTNQWYFNNNPIAGQTNASLTLQNLQLTSAGNYTVTIGSVNGITNSTVANLTMSSGNNLRWNDGGTSGVWDTGATANWLNLANSTQTTFNPGDSVLFDDTPSVSTSINVSANVSPSVVTFNSSTNNYTLGGPNSLTGNASFIKSGSSTLTIYNPATFTGPVTINGGDVYAGNSSFKYAASITVTNNATLDFGGSTYNTGQPLVISGTGNTNEGALYNSYNDDPNQVYNISLGGNATIGGGQRWDLVAGSSISGAHKLTINFGSGGYGEWNGVILVSNLGDIEVATGTLGLKNMGNTFGNPAGNIIVDSGCQLDFYSADSGYVKNFHVLGGGQLQILANVTKFAGNVTFEAGSQFTSVFGSGTQMIGGSIVLNGDTHFVFGDANSIFTNIISGAGGFVWDAYNHDIILAAANTYTGPTVIGGGLTLALTNSGSISDSSVIFFGGSTPSNLSLDASGRTDGTLTLASGQTLGGIGTINGKLVVSSGAAIAPAGTNTILNMTEGSNITGTLSASNNIVLAGNTVMKLNGSEVSDQIASSTKITFGGTLTVANVSGSPLAAGNSFQLFSAPVLSGSFTISPTVPGPGLAWDMSQLTVNGSLNVIAGSAAPVIQNVKIQSGQLLFSGSGGTPSASYVVYTETNLASTNWIPVMTNAFDSSGNFNVTNTVNASRPVSFYRIK